MPFLDWINKNQALEAVRSVPVHLLKQEAIFGNTEDGPPENLLIHGDNLLALRALVPMYAGRIKCVYIDPPYNTRSAFEHYDDKLEHSQWLSMMYPRLVLLRELLSENGSIWVSIDDNEGHYLKVLMDEVFGRTNFVTTFIWQKVDSPNDNKPPITPDHEFVLCYEKVKGRAGFRKKGDTSILDGYAGQDEKGRWYRDRILRKNGKNSLRTDRETMYFELEAPDGTAVYPIRDDGKEGRWSHGKKGIAKASAEGRLIWKEREKDGHSVWVPYIREFAPPEPARPHPTILLDVKTTRQAKAHQAETLPDAEAFDTVKPEQLIARIFEIATSSSTDWVLDSFLGSGTTASVAHKMGLPYIGIEAGDHARTHCIPRLQKVVDGEQGGISEAIGWEGGGGFRFCTLDQAAFDADGRINPDVRFDTLASYVWHYETGTAAAGKFSEPMLGKHNGISYFLLYNGILGDKRPNSGNVLTHSVLQFLSEKYPDLGEKVIYGESTRLGAAALDAANVTFKQIPYDIRNR